MTTFGERSVWAARRDLAVLVAVVVLSFVILFTPSPPSPPLFPYADKVIHAGLFAALAWSGRRVWPADGPVAGALVAYAGLSEVIQATLLPDRSGSWTDATADIVGIAAGLLVAGAFRRPDRAGHAPARRSWT